MARRSFSVHVDNTDDISPASRVCLLLLTPSMHALIVHTLNGAALSCVDQCKYLGIVLTASRYFKCSFDHVKLKFYRCFNTVFYRSKNAGSELVSVQLMQSICLPLLMYSVEALHPNKTTINMFNHLIDKADYKIF